MKWRVSGKDPKNKYWKGLPLMDAHEFYEWSLKHTNYPDIHERWVKRKYEQKFSPSVDRLDSSKGYVLGNIEWVTHQENARRARNTAPRKTWFKLVFEIFI